LAIAYANAWMESDVDAIVGLVTDDAVITTPHGTRIVGADAVREWATGFFATGAVVDDWTIRSLIADDTRAGYEWTFTRTIDCDRRSFDGASLLTARDGKIASLSEYRREPQKP
jgi:ketosteroid isomerase-like protein